MAKGVEVVVAVDLLGGDEKLVGSRSCCGCGYILAHVHTGHEIREFVEACIVHRMPIECPSLNVATRGNVDPRTRRCLVRRRTRGLTWTESVATCQRAVELT